VGVDADYTVDGTGQPGHCHVSSFVVSLVMSAGGHRAAFL
jgi:hypothetical protein